MNLVFFLLEDIFILSSIVRYMIGTILSMVDALESYCGLQWNILQSSVKRLSLTILQGIDLGAHLVDVSK